MPTETLIVFAREPVEGKVKTRLARHIGRVAATRVYCAMLADTAALVRESFSGRAVWHIDGETGQLGKIIGQECITKSQTTGDLGERMKAAFAEEFAHGDGAVGIIGTDCPTLTGALLDELFAPLRNGAALSLIPTKDGGFAGMALAARCDALFDHVRWSTPHALADTLANAAALGLACSLTGSVSDIDQEADLAAHIVSAADKPRCATALANLLAEYGWEGECPASVVDDLGFKVSLSPPPKRIVSLVPSVTEALYDLGLWDRVVGRTDFCISPPELVASIPSVGGPKTFSPEAVLALKPDLVFADAEENDKARVEALMREGVRVFVALPRTLGDVSAFLRRVGRLCSAEGSAEVFAAKLDALVSPANHLTAVILIWNDPPMIAAPGTLTSSLLYAAGFKCLAPPGNSLLYPAATLMELAALKPEVALLPSEPWPFTEDEAGTLQNFLQVGEIFRFPGEWATWYGAKTSENIENLSKLTAAVFKCRIDIPQ